MLKKLRLSTFTAALSMGGYIGWYLTVMYICEQSLHYYRDDSMLTSVNITFLTASVITTAALVVILLLFDFEGLLSNKLMRWLPGLFMAESGIALSLANANSMTVFAAIAGVAAAFGILSVMTHLLKVKVGQRELCIGLAVALGGLIRLPAALILGATSQKYYVLVSIAVGVIAILTVHSIGFSPEGAPLVSLAEAPPRTIIHKMPFAYVLLFIICALFCMAHMRVEGIASGMLPAGFTQYEYISFIAYIGAALIIALWMEPSAMPVLFVLAAGISAASGFLASLPYFTENEVKLFAIMSFGALACFRVCVYLFIVLFSLDRPHPLFYAMFGYTVSIGGELCGAVVNDRLQPSIGTCTLILLLLIPVGGAFIYFSMKRYGYTKEGFERRHNVRAQIKRKSAELELFDRERMMVESVVLDGCDIDDLSAKLLFSRNTVRVLLRPVFEKFGVSDMDGLREYFDRLTDNEERFMAKVQEAEYERRVKQREENVSGFIQSWREHLYKRDAEKERRAKEKAQKAIEEATVTIGESKDENTAESVVTNSIADSDIAPEAAPIPELPEIPSDYPSENTQGSVESGVDDVPEESFGETTDDND